MFLKNIWILQKVTPTINKFTLSCDHTVAIFRRASLIAPEAFRKSMLISYFEKAEIPTLCGWKLTNSYFRGNVTTAAIFNRRENPHLLEILQNFRKIRTFSKYGALFKIWPLPLSEAWQVAQSHLTKRLYLHTDIKRHASFMKFAVLVFKCSRSQEMDNDGHIAKT